MLTRFLTLSLIGVLLVIAVALTIPEYLNYLWYVFGFIFAIGLGVLSFIYIKRLLNLMKNANSE